MNYLIVNLILLCSLSMAAMNTDQVKAAARYAQENWGVVKTCYKKIFGAEMVPVEKVDVLTSSLGNF